MWEISINATRSEAMPRINRLGWIDAKQLNSDGPLKPRLAPHCGGFAIEVELCIPKNSVPEPECLRTATARLGGEAPFGDELRAGGYRQLQQRLRHPPLRGCRCPSDA